MATKLKTIPASVPVSPAKQTSSSKVPIVKVEGNVVRKYNRAKEVADRAELAQKQQRPLLLDAALPEFYRLRCGGLDISSVKLEDSSGEVATVSFTSKYSAVDTEKAEGLFTQLDADINAYVVQNLSASFDSSVFSTSSGKFRRDVYEAFYDACQQVAEKFNLLDAEGHVYNPLRAVPVTTVKPEFHAQRFEDFSADEQPRITSVLSNTVTIKPQRTPGKS